MKKNFLLLVLGLALIGIGCQDDDVEVPNDEEVITTVNFGLLSASGDAVMLTFQDLDGDGGNDPVITGGTLAANTSYIGALELLNETETPAEDITEEIVEEDDEHQFFFASTIADLSVAYGDMDGNGNPIGLLTTVTTGEAGSGTLTLILRHEPSKDAAGVSDGDISNAGGETDIEISFPIDVQ